MKIDLFGPPTLIIDGTLRRHGARKAMAMLAYLAMRAGEPVMRQHLAVLLWPDTDAGQARISLRQALAQLRALLGDEASRALRSEQDRLMLDAAAFDIPARRVLTDPDPDLAADLAAGPGFLEGFSIHADGFDTWASAERHGIETRMADRLEQSGKAGLAAKDPGRAAQHLALALRLDPFRESAHRMLMQAEADLGRTAEALAQYERCRAVLQEQLGVEPDAETRGLAARLRASRLARQATSDPMFQTFATRAQVAIFASGPHPTDVSLLFQGHAGEALQAALESLRAGEGSTPRLVAVVDRGRVQDTATEARGLMAAHAGAGVLVSGPVFALFEAWSPFSFSAPTAAGHHLLLGEMPRHRLQMAPTTSRPEAKFSAGNSLVLLPFSDHSPQAGRLDLGMMISEEVLTRLSRFRLLDVAGQSAGWTCRALGLSNAQIHERLGVTYAVSGSVARLDDRLVVSYSITDLASDRQVFGDRFDGRFSDLFEQQSLMVDRIASTLVSRTEEANIKRLEARLTNNIGAYELYLRGLSLHRRGGLSVSNAHAAVRHFDQAIRIDQGFVRAHAYRMCASSWIAPVATADGLRDVDRLVRMDENDAEVHRISGALYQIAGQSDLATAHVDRAVELNPSDAYLLASSAVYRAYADDGQGALRQIERAMQLDPFLPSWCIEEHGVVLYATGDFDGAARSLYRLAAPSPRALSYLAAALVALSDHAAAAAVVARLRQIRPDYSVETFMQLATFRQPAVREALRARLARAGLP